MVTNLIVLIANDMGVEAQFNINSNRNSSADIAINFDGGTREWFFTDFPSYQFVQIFRYQFRFVVAVLSESVLFCLLKFKETNILPIIYNKNDLERLSIVSCTDCYYYGLSFLGYAFQVCPKKVLLLKYRK